MGLRPSSKRLAQHEAGLGHRAFRGVHQKEAAVHHAQDALDLAAEVRVAGGVDYVDLDSLVLHCGVLGEDGDAALPLQHVRVHRPFGKRLPVPQLGGLLQQAVHERRLAVVDVRDDGDVPVIHVSPDASRAPRHRTTKRALGIKATKKAAPRGHSA